MSQEKKIIQLYTEKKFSEQQIAKHLSVGPEHVRRVLRKHQVPKRSISEAIRYWHITNFKKKEFLLNTKLSPEQEMLKLTGVMLYWGEGTKGRNTVAFTNSDPTMIAVFARFLREICGIDNGRLRLSLHFYPDHDREQLTKFWMKVVGVPFFQVHRPHIHNGTKGSYKMKSQYGTVSVIYSDKKLLELINRWIAEYKNRFA